MSQFCYCLFSLNWDRSWTLDPNIYWMIFVIKHLTKDWSEFLSSWTAHNSFSICVTSFCQQSFSPRNPNISSVTVHVLNNCLNREGYESNKANFTTAIKPATKPFTPAIWLQVWRKKTDFTTAVYYTYSELLPCWSPTNLLVATNIATIFFTTVAQIKSV